MTLLFDCETDGLLHDVTTVHCLVIKDTETGQVDSYVGPAQVRKALPRLTAADRIIAHNGIKYDIPVLQKLFPGFQVDQSRVIDTLVLSRLIHADIKEADFDRMKTQGYPGKLCGSHALKAWGYRLGKQKGEYAEKAGADPSQGPESGTAPLQANSQRVAWPRHPRSKRWGKTLGERLGGDLLSD